MQTQIKKWGNSLAVHIPKVYAEQMGFYPNSPVNITIVNGKLIIEPVHEPKLTLDNLLAQITAANLHQEVVAEPRLGNEAW